MKPFTLTDTSPAGADLTGLVLVFIPARVTISIAFLADTFACGEE
jgi:hypothetical protein